MSKSVIILITVLSLFFVSVLVFIVISQQQQINQLISNQRLPVAPTTNPVIPSPSLPVATPTLTDEEGIKAAAIADAKKSETRVMEYTISSLKIVKNHAQGAIGCLNDGCSGWIFWAVKTNNQWRVVYGSQEVPPCSELQKYSFPAEFTCQ